MSPYPVEDLVAQLFNSDEKGFCTLGTLDHDGRPGPINFFMSVF
jgi:hypothetical protein